MWSGIRRTLLQMVLALVLGAPLVAGSLPPAEEASGRSAATVVAPAPRPLELPVSTLPDEAAMVLAGTVLIGAAAAVRRAA